MTAETPLLFLCTHAHTPVQVAALRKLHHDRQVLGGGEHLLEIHNEGVLQVAVVQDLAQHVPPVLPNLHILALRKGVLQVKLVQGLAQQRPPVLPRLCMTGGWAGQVLWQDFVQRIPSIISNLCIVTRPSGSCHKAWQALDALSAECICIGRAER